MRWSGVAGAVVLAGLAYAAAPAAQPAQPPPPQPNNTAIYTLDPRGLTGMSADVLRMLSERTGGETYVGTNTPERALRQAVRDASAFYLLGYSSLRNWQDGKFHKIGVRVKRRGVDVRARRGYWAPNLTDLERARTEAAAGAAVPADVTSAMAVLSTARVERTIDIWAGVGRGADGQSEVTVAWTRAQGRAGGRARRGPCRSPRRKKVVSGRSMRAWMPAVSRSGRRLASCSC